MSSLAPQREVAAAHDRRIGLASLTGMRFIAALMVFLFHVTRPEVTWFKGETAADLNSLGANLGFAGVSFFFILSGFVLTWSARPGDRTRQFWRRRVVKIFPNHIVTFIIAMLLFASAYTTWEAWLPNLLLIQAWIPDPATFFSVNIPSWSLSCELFFYLMFPLIYRALSRIRPERLWAWATGVAGLIVAMPAIAYTLLPSDPVMGHGFPVSKEQLWFIYLLPPVRALEFVLGILMALIVIKGKWIRLGVLPAVLLALGGYAISLQLPLLYGFQAATVIPLALLIPAAATADIKGNRSILRSRTAIWLGEVSFAFYLMQAIVITEAWEMFGDDLISDTPRAIGIVILAGCVNLFLAGVLHMCVERPMMRRFSRPRRAPSIGQRAEPRQNIAA